MVVDAPARLRERDADLPFVVPAKRRSRLGRKNASAREAPPPPPKKNSAEDAADALVAALGQLGELREEDARGWRGGKESSAAGEKVAAGKGSARSNAGEEGGAHSLHAGRGLGGGR